MTTDPKGRELFIVDNSVSGWTGLRYLEEWSSIAKAFDIATGYFEIGALLTLDGKWQELDKIRILMGTETTHRTRKAILEAVRAQALDRLDESIEEDKEPNPFLRGVPAILAALRSGQIECRVYDKDKFHAKAYITHAKLEVVGAQALVGSSNFTRPGLTKNIELNVQIQSAREVAQLQEWFETHWNEARDVTETVIDTISRHTHLYSPFDVYAKALQQFFRGHELTATEWDETRSRMFPHVDRYQKEAYWALMKIARQHGGAFLCDGVGLGKTFVGLMLIERLILHEGKRVALFAPKAAKEGVWEPHLRRWLPHIGGVGGGADFSNLAVFSHTDLGRKGEFPERFQRIAELADVVVIDEAHHFRNPGRRGDPDWGIEPSRYYRLFELLDNTSCLILPCIGEGRRDGVEAHCAGQRLDDLDRADLPPCVGERVSFMAPFALTRTMTHPYKEFYPETHGHFEPTRFMQPEYSAACVPFRWMLREKVEGSAKDGEIGIAERLKIGWVLDREPDIRNHQGNQVETAWVQESENQLALLDTFFGALRPEESLCFFYAKRTPLSEQPRRVIVGVGRVLSVGEPTEYEYKVKNPPLRCVLWERNVGHSVRPSFADGFLFPYQEALALAEREGVDPEEFVAFAPDEHFDAYSYGSELLTHDGAVASLVTSAATLHRIRGRIEGPWDQALA